MRLYLIIIVSIVVFGIIFQYVIRKDLPYNFDIIRTADGVAVINSDNWVTRDLKVKVEQNGKKLAEDVLFSKTHSSFIGGIGAPGLCRVIISRMDLLGRFLYRPLSSKIDLNGKAQDYIILVGASIGNQWNLPMFPDRIQNDRLVFGHRIKYKFDKSDLIESILNYKLKPKAVVIKECSEYFPRDIESSVEYRKQWVSQLLAAEIIPIFATTPPVAKMPGKDVQQASIDEWNRSIRKMSQMEKYIVLDLADALRTSLLDTHLKPGYFIDDGLHMTPLAYKEAFDPTLKKLLDDIF